jgi:DNA-binding response OmpR family regulator
MNKILIIEDDLIVSNIYRNKLAVEGFQVDIAHNGEEGLFQITKNKPDVVILDLCLPKMNGVEVINKIRANPATLTLPIIVFSNTYLTTLVQQAWKAGANKCLSKANCSPKEVIEAVRNMLGQKDEAANKGATVFMPRAKIAVSAPPASSTINESRASFNGTFPSQVAALRASIQSLSKATTDTERTQHASDLYRTAHKLTGGANVSGLSIVAQLCEAIEALLTELHEKPANINTSNIRTLANAVDFLPALFEHAIRTGALESSNSNILVVDDEPIARRAVSQALDRANLKSVGVDDANTALKLLSENSYDLVFLDVDMPEINGHELCSKLRSLPRHRNTPVVFVTSNTDLKNRANSTISGGNDFIGKPFHFLELAVKSLVYVMRAKIQPAKLV